MTAGGKPVIGISMGDPAGIGPEIIVKALARADVRQLCTPVVVGDPIVIERATRIVHSPTKVLALSTNGPTEDPAVINVVAPRGIEAAAVPIGVVSADAGRAAFESVKKLIDLATAGHIDATVTAPIHKEALHRAGHFFPGHTEIFAHFTGTADYTMMLAEGAFRVAHVSTHVSLRAACDAVTRPRVLNVIRLANDACLRLGIARPRVGVAGLNPHASDGGLFGDEEANHIAPAIADARVDGIAVDGPWPADTLFPKVAGGGYDVGIAMYHDQGHVAVKMRGFVFDGSSNTWTSVRGINVTLGLPIVRVSVDHGTGFDQAGKGTASESSMVDAISYAARLARARLG
jgi:4-phospho-D-threonate 3-dehydrogenase / 4-phospho-D-erythronate 3-dehydrogenase